MFDLANLVQAVLCAWLVDFLACFAAWGIQPLMRQRFKQLIRRRERVRFSSDVNTDLIGFQVRPNRWQYVMWTVAWLFFVCWRPPIVLLVIGSMLYMGLMLRKAMRNSRFQQMQSYVLTERSVWVFLERQGQMLWQGVHRKRCLWEELDGYRIDGSYVQLYREENMVLQFEFAPYDLDVLRQLLQELHVQRLDHSDRIWVAQLDEQAFQLLEDELCELGYHLLDLFKEELQQLKVRPEFGVMRNMPGDRLLEEHARSWLQLNLIDVASGERRASSSFPLWQSSGSVGFLVGARGQEAIERLQQWIKAALQEATDLEEEVVS